MPYYNEVLLYLEKQTWLRWIGNHMVSKEWCEIICPFQNVNEYADEVWEWVNNFSLHLTLIMIAYPGWDQS